jgi:hypothetical protein
MNLTSSYTTFRREALQTSLPGVWLHGSSKPFESFRLGKYKKSQQLGFGIHFTQDESFASLYGPYIYSCNLFPTQILDTEELYSIGSEEEKFARALHKGTQRRLFVSDNQFVIHLDITPPSRAERLLKQFGYDAVIYKAVFGSAAIGGMHVSNKARSVVMLDPGKIKILKVDEL